MDFKERFQNLTGPRLSTRKFELGSLIHTRHLNLNSFGPSPKRYPPSPGQINLRTRPINFVAGSNSALSKRVLIGTTECHAAQVRISKSILLPS